MNIPKNRLIEEIINSDSPILIDIDETGFNFLPRYVDYLNYTYGLDLDASDIVVYDFSNIKPLKDIGVTYYDIIENLRNFGNTEEFVKIKPLDGFMEFYKLVTHGFNDLEKKYFVTSRSEEFYDNPRGKTIQTLNNSNVPFLDKNLILTDNKHDFAMDIGAKYVFDDSVHIAKQFLTNNYSGHIIMNNTAVNTLTDKDKTLLDDRAIKEKKRLVELTHDPRVTRMNGWYDLLN